MCNGQVPGFDDQDCGRRGEDKREHIMNFEKELEELINRYSKENESNTPDFILAQYIENCLSAFTCAVQQRETWYGRDARPTLSVMESV